MARMFCRHNRIASSCPICSKELQAELPSAPRRPTPRGASAPAKRRGASSSSSRRPSTGGVVTRRLSRAADDGYRNALVPGLRATVDARRLAAALLVAIDRLKAPGPVPEAAAGGDAEEGTWIAFARVLGADDVPPLAGDELPEVPAGARRALESYRPWAERSGGAAAALAGDPTWTPERRFARAYERLSLPGLTRHARIEFLHAVAAAGLYDLAQDSLHVERDDDAATVAAKRLLVSGDRGLLDRRARDLVTAAGVPFDALEHGLALWDGNAQLPESEAPPPALASALAID